MSTHDMEETGMTERLAVLDFPGAEALQVAGWVEPPSPRVLARVLEGVEDAVREEAAQAPPGGDVRGDVVVTPLRWRRRVVALLAAAAVAAGIAVTSANTGGAPATMGGAPANTQAQSASIFLNNVAEVAATQPAGAGTYWKIHTAPFNAYAYISRSMELTYLVPGKTFDGNRSRTGRFPGWRLGSQNYDWNGLDRLSTDPLMLQRVILSTTKASAEQVEDAGTLGFVQASTVLAVAPASPALRAGLFKALAKVQGVRVVGTAKDSAGRTGTKLAYHGDVGVTEVIIDPKTSTLLQLNEPWRSEKDQRRATYVSVGLTDKIG
ncbi:hypothetical protein OG206_31640 [Streptomyces sp. NBC_01341]|uniref:hypothetical protein n=1 Tax=Streptomyces sp. NBC_01341 TaxID=2903831 RepID=UPI002E0DF255|nr:hypothetical protein OG206_31640 [Streptomyces sp. NBC_01341]